MPAPRSFWFGACLAAFLSSLSACATKDGVDDSAPALESAPSDASPPAEPAPIAITEVPSAGTHLDGPAAGYRPRGYQPRPTTKGKIIELVLRSSPPGAMAAIDGKSVGVTPAFWSGEADQRAHEFTFVKDGHTMARYRFVATHSGVVHGSLLPLQTSDEAEAPGVVEH